MIEMKSEIKGAKQAIISLRKIDPEYRKDFNREAKNIAAPLVSAAKAAYPDMPLSGMKNKWIDKQGRELLPWSVTKVRAGVKLKTATRKSASSVLYITQSTPTGAIFEVAGLANPGANFNRNLRSKNSRVLWPTADKYLPEVTRGLVKLVEDVMDKVEKEMR
jgi:hypothetical protein